MAGITRELLTERRKTLLEEQQKCSNEIQAAQNRIQQLTQTGFAMQGAILGVDEMLKVLDDQDAAIKAGATEVFSKALSADELKAAQAEAKPAGQAN